MRRYAKRLLSGLVVAGVVACLPTSANAQQYLYSDVVPTPTECDAANPGGAYAAWVQFLPSKKVELELNTTLPGDSAAAFFTHLTQYANGQTKDLPANTLQFVVSYPSATGTFFPVVEYQVPGQPVQSMKLSPTAIQKGDGGRKEVVYYDMHADGIPPNARLINLYLFTYYDNGGPFFGYFQDFVLNGTRILNKNFTTYPCVGDIAQKIKMFAP